MEFVFPAIERRFDRDRKLKTLGRKLYLGSADPVRVVKEWVELTVDDINRDFDTFNSDEPVYSLTFTAWTKSRSPVKCSQIMRHIERVFHDCDLQSQNFLTVGFRMTGGDGPVLEDSAYKGTRSFELSTFLKSRRPSTLRTA